MTNRDFSLGPDVHPRLTSNHHHLLMAGTDPKDNPYLAHNRNGSKAAAPEPPPKAGTDPKDNPYLAHHYKGRKGAAPEPTPNPSIKEPLYGFWPRKVIGEQVRKALVRN